MQLKEHLQKIALVGRGHYTEALRNRFKTIRDKSLSIPVKEKLLRKTQGQVMNINSMALRDVAKNKRTFQKAKSTKDIISTHKNFEDSKNFALKTDKYERGLSIFGKKNKLTNVPTGANIHSIISGEGKLDWSK